MSKQRQAIFASLLLTSLLLPFTTGAAEITFQEHVLPIFCEHCTGCHNPDKKKADLDLSSYKSTLAGGGGGAVLKAGSPDSSILYQAVTHANDAEPMPPKKAKLPDEQLQLIRAWIQNGLVESKGGKSQLRKIEFNIAMGSANRPAGNAAVPDWPDNPVSKSAITALAASPWADAFVVSGNEQIIAYTDNQTAGAVPFPEGVIHDLRFSRNGSMILAAGGHGAHSGKAVIFDVKTGRRVAEIGNESDSVLSADLSADHQLVALGGPARLLKIYSTKSGELRHRIEKHTDWVTAVAFSPDGKLVASGDRSGGLHVWESDTGAIVFTLDEHKVRVTRLAWRADGKMLASAGDDGKLVLWDMQDGWPAKVIDAHVSKAKTRHSRQTGILGLDWHRDGRLVTVGRDRSLRIWDAAGNRIGNAINTMGLPLSVTFNGAGSRLFVGQLDGTVSSFDAIAATRADASPRP